MLKKGKGNTWMKQHLNSVHGGEWVKTMQAAKLLPDVPIEQFAVRHVEAENIHRWIRFISKTNQPMTCVSGPEMRSFVKMKPMC